MLSDIFNKVSKNNVPIDPHLPYKRGEWEQFYEYFLEVIRKYKFAFYNFLTTATITLVEMDSDQEKIDQKLPYGKTAYIDINKDIVVYERFLIEKQVNGYEFAVVLMHEILHHALGHMKDFREDKEKNPRETSRLVKNIIFDALINSTITKKFNFDQRITSFFEKMYPHDKSPDNLLRPNSTFDDPFNKDVYDALYGESSTTFYDLRCLIEENMDESTQDIVLVGGHGGGGQSDLEAEWEKDPDKEEAFDDAAQDIIEDMLEGDEEEEVQGGSPPDPNPTTLFRRTLKNYIDTHHDHGEDVRLVPNPAEFKHHIDHDFMKIKGQQKRRSIFPSRKDRRCLVYRAMGIYQPFYKVPKKDTAAHAVAYIDVSGSTYSYHKIFFSSIYFNLDHFDSIYAFSTKIYECSEDDVKNRTFETTGGTDDCWVEHMLKNKINNAVVYTDGYIWGEHWKKLDLANTNLIVVFMDADKGHSDGGWFKPLEKCIIKMYSVDPEGKFIILDKLPGS